MKAIEFKDVSFSYDDENKILALKNLSFCIEKGEFVCIIGHNGSGKSTIGKLINALLTPTSGKVFVNGLDSSDYKNTFEIRKKAGMVFQNPDNQMVAQIVEDDIAFGPENIGANRDDIARKIDFALTATDMHDFRFKQSANLSGGQKQRVAIAGVLAIEPDILILDESTAMLDPKGRKMIMEVAKKLNRENGMTIINITHYMNEATECDRILLMSNHRLISDGTPYEIFNGNIDVTKYNLEYPRAKTIASELHKQGVDIDPNIYKDEELEKALCKLFQTT